MLNELDRRRLERARVSLQAAGRDGAMGEAMRRSGFEFDTELGFAFEVGWLRSTVASVLGRIDDVLEDDDYALSVAEADRLAYAEREQGAGRTFEAMAGEV
jgi:hypothetical protein